MAQRTDEELSADFRKGKLCTAEELERVKKLIAEEMGSLDKDKVICAVREALTPEQRNALESLKQDGNQDRLPFETIKLKAELAFLFYPLLQDLLLARLVVIGMVEDQYSKDPPFKYATGFKMGDIVEACIEVRIVCDDRYEEGTQ
jgi:hypothetical protein